MEAEGARRTGLLLGGGALVALLAGGLIAWSLVAGHRGETTPPPPASKGGLVIDEANMGQAKPVAPAKPLRCFVAGQYVGDFTLADCAKRNGVATDQLDVGVDKTGALAAAQQGGSVVAPLPPPVAAKPEAPRPEAAQAGPLAECWRYGDGTWRRLPNDMALPACVQTLFAGRCEKPGQALYGRWGQQTLRLVPGKVEVSADNRSFHTLQDQACPG